MRKRRIKNKNIQTKIIRINLSLVIGIIAIVFSLFAFILNYKLAIIGTSKLENFRAETLINNVLSTASSTEYTIYNDITLYAYNTEGTNLGYEALSSLSKNTDYQYGPLY